MNNNFPASGIKGISIVICCYNSSPRLEETLKHLSLQRGIDPENWELIIVDNNSTDGTAEIARKHWSDLKGAAPMHIVAEKAPGLTHARAAGVRAAANDIIIFCDDDNWLQENYLKEVAHIFSTLPKVGMAGPANMPGVYEGPKPAWLHGHENILCVFDSGYEEITINKNSEKLLHIAGAGMAIRKSILENYLHDLANNPQRLILDRSPGKMLSGGDDDINLTALNEGHDLLLTNKLQLKHFVPAFKMKKDYILKLYEGMAYSLVLLNHFHGRPEKNRFGWNPLGLAKVMVINAFKSPFRNQLLMRSFKGRREAKKYLQTII